MGMATTEVVFTVPCEEHELNRKDRQALESIAKRMKWKLEFKRQPEIDTSFWLYKK